MADVCWLFLRRVYNVWLKEDLLKNFTNTYYNSINLLMREMDHVSTRLVLWVNLFGVAQISPTQPQLPLIQPIHSFIYRHRLLTAHSFYFKEHRWRQKQKFLFVGFLLIHSSNEMSSSYAENRKEGMNATYTSLNEIFYLCNNLISAFLYGEGRVLQ